MTAPSPARSPWIGLGVLCTGMLMVVMDATVVNVALPTIKNDLGFTQSDLAWVVNAFVIAFGGLLLLAGRLGDLIGRKRVFTAGLVAFTLASLLCGLAQSQGVLVGARFVQGVGGAMCAGVILGMIVTMFQDPRDIGKAFGVFTFVLAAGSAVGLVVGGVLTQAINWHWIFLINIPIGIAAVVLAMRVLPDDVGSGLGRGTDVAGAVLVTAGLMLGVYTIVETIDRGWTSAHTVGFGAVSLVLLAAFVAREATAASPLLPLRIFRSRNLSGANLVMFLYVATAFGMFFVSALYLQLVQGYDALQVGLAFMPLTVVTAIVTLGFSARLNVRFGGRAVLLAGLTINAVALALLTRVSVDSGYVAGFLPSMLLLGVGGGLALPAMTALAMADAAPSDAGLAGGLANTTQQIGAALGLAVLATLATSRTNALLADGTGTASALIGGYRLAFVLTVAFLVVAIVVTATVLRRPATAPSAPAPGQDEAADRVPTA